MGVHKASTKDITEADNYPEPPLPRSSAPITVEGDLAHAVLIKH